MLSLFAAEDETKALEEGQGAYRYFIEEKHFDELQAVRIHFREVRGAWLDLVPLC